MFPLLFPPRHLPWQRISPGHSLTRRRFRFRASASEKNYDEPVKVAQSVPGISGITIDLPGKPEKVPGYFNLSFPEKSLPVALRQITLTA